MHRRTPLPQPGFLPTTRAEMRALGWNTLDVLLVTGDAYVDHPSFGVPLLGRWLVAHGFTTGIVAQPDWRGTADVARMGRPRLLAGVTAGALDSQLAHYTAFRKKRSDDAYTPGGKAGSRPNRACLVYANLVRQAFPGLSVALGGIEASLRRAAHYDFWSDTLRRSLLLDAKAELLVYGMAEQALLETVQRLDTNDPRGLKAIPGTAFAAPLDELPALLPKEAETTELPSRAAIQVEPKLLMDATLAMEAQAHRGGPWLVQRETDGDARAVVLAPPAKTLSTSELDALYALPFARRAHPAYTDPIPALEMIRGSISSHRGCGGGCSFCGLALHQGRRIVSRSRESILAEAARVGGSISDVGGPSANMWNARCTLKAGQCRRTSCLTPQVCPQLEVDQRAYVDLLRAVAASPGVNHVRVASGVRYDLALQDKAALDALVTEFVGGQLKIAPEHICPEVTALMRKPGVEVFDTLLERFGNASRQAGKEQYVVPYLMSAHPGCTEQHMDGLAAWLKARGWRPRQVQCFTPLPGTVAAAMYYAGVDERGRPIPVARSDAERLAQHGRLTRLIPAGKSKGRKARLRAQAKTQRRSKTAHSAKTKRLAKPGRDR